MTTDRGYIAENDAELRRFRSFVERLTDAELASSLPDGWTVAASLAHVALWDQRVLVLLDQWDAGVRPRLLDDADVDWINDAAKPLCLALAPREAARLALEVAARVDARVAALSDARVAENHAGGQPIRLSRAPHRRVHREEIEAALRI